jgi:superfamily II DNA or RNA helicase
VAAKGKRVCILAHRRELLRQIGQRLSDFGVPFATIDAATRQVSRSPVAVASVQTLARRLEQYPDAFDLLVIDEAHHAVAGQWRAVVESFPLARVLGVTATPQRLDGRGLADAFEDMVVGPSVRDLIEQGRLSDYAAFAPPGGGPDLSRVRTKLGDFDLAALAVTMSGPELVGDAVEHYRRLAPGLPAVAFCVTVKHAELVAQSFRDAGFRAVSVDGKLDAAERDRRIGGLADGSVGVLTSCELISEGLDIPGISAAILLRPTQSMGLYTQQVGRALRPKPGGGKAVILDHAGNIHRHGLPCAERDWSLTSKKRKGRKGQAPVKSCESCEALVPAACRSCPSCGADFPGADDQTIAQRDGELVRIERDWSGVPKNRRAIDEAALAARNWEELTALRKALGFKRGWEFHVARQLGWSERANAAGFVVRLDPPGRAA